MIKNLSIVAEKYLRVDKLLIHKIVGLMKSELNLSIESLNINFVSLESILDVNKKYLGHKYTTDIITFNYSGDKQNLDGEMFISVADALANSKRFNCSLDSEILRLIIHGILHMVGYDDHLQHDKIIMKKKENRLLKDFEYLIKGNLLVYDSKNS